MSKLRSVWVAAVLSVVASMNAQEIPEVLPVPELPPAQEMLQGEAARPYSPQIGVSLTPEPEAPNAQGRQIRTDTVVDGTNGSIDFTSPSPHTTTGVLLKSQASWPNIGARLNTSGTFSIFDASDAQLFAVRSDGIAYLTKNQGAENYFAISNATASGSNAIRLTEGGTTHALLSATNSGFGTYPNWVSLYNVANGNLNFGTNNVERMRIYADGKVAIQPFGTETSSPYNAQLLVQDGVDGARAIFASHQPTYETTGDPQVDYGIFIQTHEKVLAGAVNGGVLYGLYGNSWLTDQGILSNATGAFFQVGTAYNGFGTVSSAIGLRAQVTRVAGSTITKGYGLYLDDAEATTGYGVYQVGTDDANYFAGAVGVGMIPNGAKLDVKAPSTMNGIRVLGTAASDYVGYALGRTGSEAYLGMAGGPTHYAALASAGDLVLRNDTEDIILTARNATGRILLATGATDAAQVTVTNAGNVGIGTTTPSAKLQVAGNIVASGSITGATVIGAVYQDLAEWVPASVDMEPGTVVVLNTDKSNEVMPSSSSYATTVAGVVSAQPGLILGVGSDSKEQIATTGRVRVRVDASRGAIAVGDLLVTSDLAGTAMRSEPMEINGRKFHQPGTIIGKALEPLADGIGEILVLLSMQ